MDYFWKENKKFVIAVGAGALVVILYWSFLVSPFRAGAVDAARRRAQEKRDYEALIAQGVPAKDAVAAASQDRDETKKILASLVKDVGFKLPERYKKDRDVYDDLRIKVKTELKEKATKAKIDFQGDLGLNEEIRDEDLPELLLRLAAVERVVSQAVDAGVEKIESVDGMADARESGPPQKKGGFLRAYSVFVKLRASSEAAFRVIHGVQKKGNYLAVTKFSWAQDDPARDMGSASITVAVLRVDEKAPLEAKAEERP
ncbi:MAG TPA: hypothetical protein VF950_22935 [Planctomycetota bacterium]